MIIDRVRTVLINNSTTKPKENKMSMEKELGRIADALERIEGKMFATAERVDAPKAPAKKKVTPKKETGASGADFGEGKQAGGPEGDQNSVAEPVMTPEELLKYANGQILAVADLKKRSKIVQKLKAMFQKNYGVTSVKAIPADKVDECKAAFALIMEAGE